MSSKLIIQLFTAILFLISGLTAFLRGIFEPSERSAIAGVALIITGACLLFMGGNNRRELKPVRVRAKN